MSTLVLYSTMLPETVVHRFDLDEIDVDNIEDDLADAFRLVQDQPGAEWRVRLEDAAHIDQWLVDAASNKNKLDLYSLIKLAMLADDWTTEQVIMAYIYAVEMTYTDIDDIVSGVESNNWFVAEIPEDEADDVDAKFGRAYYDAGHTDMDLAGNEGWFDFAGFGADNIEYKIPYGGSIYAAREWA